MKDQIINISYCKTDFNCSVCNKEYTEKDYFKQLQKSKTFLIYKTCKSCNTKLGITANMKGYIVVWEKSKEIKLSKNM